MNILKGSDVVVFRPVLEHLLVLGQGALGFALQSQALSITCLSSFKHPGCTVLAM